MKNRYNLKKSIIKAMCSGGVISLVSFAMIGFSTPLWGQENLIIRGGSVNMSQSSSIKTNSLIIDNYGALCIKDQSNSITVNGDFTNNSLVSNQLNGTTIFKGSGNNSINGNNEIQFANLKINKSNSNCEITLKQNIIVNNKLNIEIGKIELSDFDINLLKTGELINENNLNYIKSDLGFGKITATRLLSIGKNTNIAGLGIDITTNNYIGYKTIERFHQTRTNVVESINRFYRIPNFGDINKDNYISIHYLTPELNGLIEPELTLINQNNKFEIKPIKSDIDIINKTVRTDIKELASISENDEYSIFTLANLKNDITPIHNIKPEIESNFKAFYSRNNQSIEIQYSAKIDGSSTLELTNSLSKSVLQKNISTTKGENFYSLNVSELATGSYFLIFKSNNEDKCVKLIITR